MQKSPLENLSETQLLPNDWTIPGKSEFMALHWLFILSCLVSLAKQEHRITVHVAFHYVAWQLRNI